MARLSMSLTCLVFLALLLAVPTADARPAVLRVTATPRLDGALVVLQARRGGVASARLVRDGRGQVTRRRVKLRRGRARRVMLRGSVRPGSRVKLSTRFRATRSRRAIVVTRRLRIPSKPPAPGTPRGPKLTWAPPKLTNPTVVQPSSSNRTLKLDTTRDYIIDMPGAAVSGTGGLVIAGGHHVVLIGGEIDVPWQGAVPPSNARRGLYLKGQTGTVHVEGLRIRGADLAEGINLDQRLGAIVQLQNVRIEPIRARDEVAFSDTHPDLLQSWAGPAELRVDRFTGTTDYQGFFLQPTQYGSQVPRGVDLRHVDLHGLDRGGVLTAGVLLWKGGSTYPVEVDDVWIEPDPTRGLKGSLWPSPDAWSGVLVGKPPAGPHVPVGVAGTQYVSPGYS
jgi:hypothetical protein